MYRYIGFKLNTTNIATIVKIGSIRLDLCANCETSNRQKPYSVKKILKITETVDNWGGVDSYQDTNQIKDYLKNPAYFSDDAWIEYEENGNKGVCFMDDLIGHEVMVGEEIILVKEK